MDEEPRDIYREALQRTIRERLSSDPEIDRLTEGRIFTVERRDEGDDLTPDLDAEIYGTLIWRGDIIPRTEQEVALAEDGERFRECNGFIEQEIGVYAQGYSWGIGIKFRSWGVRIMLLRWHLCLRWPWRWYSERKG